MEVTRHDGTRFITEDEIDREFTDRWVLIRVDDENNLNGFLVASAVDYEGVYDALSDIAMVELNAQARIKYGCRTRGDSLHVQLLG